MEEQGKAKLEVVAFADNDNVLLKKNQVRYNIEGNKQGDLNLCSKFALSPSPLCLAIVNLNLTGSLCHGRFAKRK